MVLRLRAAVPPFARIAKKRHFFGIMTEKKLLSPKNGGAAAVCRAAGAQPASRPQSAAEGGRAEAAP